MTTYTLQELADAKGTSEPVRQMLFAFAKENEALRKELGDLPAAQADTLAECKRLRAQVDELGKDAERYRWLRRAQVELSLSNDTIAGLVRSVCDIDAAIDAQKGKV